MLLLLLRCIHRGTSSLLLLLLLLQPGLGPSCKHNLPMPGKHEAAC